MSDTNHVALQGNFFSVKVDGEEIAFFTSCSGISIEFETAEMKSVTKEGKQVVQKIPTKTKYAEVVLKRGYTPDDKLYKWFLDVRAGKVIRKTGEIAILDSVGKVKARFSFDQMWPSKVT